MSMLDDRHRTMSEIGSTIERLGFGWAQVSQLIVGGGIWASDAAELLMIGSITRSLSDEWHISGNARGTAASIIFVGICIGNILSGPIGDHLGRKCLIFASYIGVVAFGCLSATAVDLTGILVCRILVGISIGIGQPSWNALAKEMTPQSWHASVVMFAQMLFAVGEAYAVVLLYLDDPNMKDLEWRRLLVQAALLPLVLLVLAFFFFQESPHFLAVRGDTEAAEKVLQWMRQANGKPDVDINLSNFASVVQNTAAGMHSSHPDALSEPHQWFAPLKIVFGRWLLSTTFLFCFSAFVLNFIFYGGLYALPQVLPTMKMNSSPVAVLLLRISTEVPGYVLGSFMTNRLSKRTAMLLYIFFCMLGQVPYATLVDGSSDGVLPGAGKGRVSVLTEALLVGGTILSKVSNAAGWIVIYTLVSKAYPTESRTTGSAVCLACGRLGAISAPLVYEALLKQGVNAQGFFIFTTALCMMNLLIVITIEHSVKEKEAEEIECIVDSGPSYT